MSCAVARAPARAPKMKLTTARGCCSSSWVIFGETRHRTVAMPGPGPWTVGGCRERSRMSPRAVVNGVYRIGCDESALMAQLLDYYGKALSTYPVEVSTFVERVIPVVLMDVTISDADERFNMAEFTQEMPSAPREIWQVPYDEALLSEDGSEVVARWPGCAENIGAGRIGFYFHF